MRKGAWVNVAAKREIWAMPCTLCARVDDIECDHIVGIAEGGTSVRENLQPLCRTCNSYKRWHKTNEATWAAITKNRAKFERQQEFRTKRLLMIASGDW